MEKEGLLIRSMYYGAIGQEAGEKLLERFGHEGSYLLRDSQTVQGAFCLCVRKTPSVYTYRISHSKDGWYLQESEVPPLRFRTLEALIETCKRDAGIAVSIPTLTEPLTKTQVQNQQGSGFSYMK